MYLTNVSSFFGALNVRDGMCDWAFTDKRFQHWIKICLVLRSPSVSPTKCGRNIIICIILKHQDTVEHLKYDE